MDLTFNASSVPERYDCHFITEDKKATKMSPSFVAFLSSVQIQSAGNYSRLSK